MGHDTLSEGIVRTTSRQLVTTDGAPAAIGPYSQAVRVGNLVFTAGQIGLVPADGSLVPGGAAEEARQVLDNLAAILDAAGASVGDVTKTTLFLVDMADFEAVNAVYAELFGASPPARSAVAVAGLPKGARVAIDAVAVIAS